MLQADPSKVSSRAKKRGLPQVSRQTVSLRQYCTSLIALGVWSMTPVVWWSFVKKSFYSFFPYLLFPPPLVVFWCCECIIIAGDIGCGEPLCRNTSRGRDLRRPRCLQNGSWAERTGTPIYDTIMNAFDDLRAIGNQKFIMQFYPKH